MMVKKKAKNNIDPVRSSAENMRRRQLLLGESASRLSKVNKISSVKTSNGVDVKGTAGGWYYSDIVKSHFFRPRNFLSKDPRKGEFDAEGMVGSPACIVSSTLIQKNPSLQKINEIKTGEFVLSGNGKFYTVNKIFKPRYNKKLIKLKSQLGELTSTLDHLIFAIQVPRNKKYPFAHTKYKKQIVPSWVHAGDLKKGDIVLYPVPKEIKEINYIYVPNFIRRKWDFKSLSLPKKIPIRKELLELFGYFVAEGSSKERELTFTFSKKEEKFALRVKKLIKKYFDLNTAIRPRPLNNRIDVSVYNIYISQLFREWFGVLAENKKVPEFILFLNPILQRGFLRGLWRGDGYFSPSRLQPRAGFVTVSETLLHEVVWLLLRQKIALSVYRERASIKNGVTHLPSYRIHVGDMTSLEKLAKILTIPFTRNPNKRHAVEAWFDENYLHVPIRKISTHSFQGRLYNFEVEGSHNYATDAFLVHNCGDMMRMWIKIDPKTERIKALKWRTFGCASAIAATSMFSVIATEKGGMKIEDALKIKPHDITQRLRGLPARKIHCSVLADKAFQKTINNYFRNTGQHQRIIIEGSKIIDERFNITDKDIEEAVLEGAQNLSDVQKKLKVGVAASEKSKTNIEELIRFYRDKYYG